MYMNDSTTPRLVKSICQIHQRRTQANTPIPTIIEKVNDTIEHVEVNDNNNIVVMGGEPRVAQWHEPLISVQHPNPKGRPNTIKDDESRLNVDHRYPTNNSNYTKDAPNIIEVDYIDYFREDTYTPTQCSPRLNRPQNQKPISQNGTTNEAIFVVIYGKMGQPKNWIPTKLKKDGI